MGRKKSDDEGDQVDLFSAMIARSQELAGNSKLLVGPAADGCIIGLRIPLALRWLFQSNVFPLGRTTILTGPSLSCKSALMYDMFRWHNEIPGGGGQLIETENKDSEELRRSINNYKEGAVTANTYGSLNDAMTAFNIAVENYKTFCEGNKKSPGRRVLLQIGLDSLTATNSDETEDNIRKKGVPERRFAVEAAMIATWLKSLSPKTLGWPLSLVFVNHDKPQLNLSTGRMMPHMPGGAAPKYQATYVLHTTKIGDIERSNWEGRKIKIKALKNSLGPDGRMIVVEMVWTHQFLEGWGVVQRTFWDWHKASIVMLLDRMGAKVKTFANRLKDVIDLHVVSGAKVWSEALGIAKEEPITMHKAGMLLDSNEELSKRIDNALGIPERTVYQPKVDFLEQIAEATKFEAARAAERPPLPPLEAANADDEEEEEEESDNG